LDAWEVQNPLNKKIISKPLRAVDFASRFVITIESMNFEFIKSTNLDAKSTALKDFEPNVWFKGL
jgi:hypothetical protein